MICRCNNSKTLQRYHENNFAHVINGQEYIDKLKTSNPDDYFTVRPVMISDIVKNMNFINDCESKTCMFKESQILQIIEKPYPKVLTLNFNWS